MPGINIYLLSMVFHEVWWCVRDAMDDPRPDPLHAVRLNLLGGILLLGDLATGPAPQEISALTQNPCQAHFHKPPGDIKCTVLIYCMGDKGAKIH